MSVSSAAADAFQQLSNTQVFNKNGYLYIYASPDRSIVINNTSMGKAVYFDDMKIVHNKYDYAQPIQLDDYYPFGMSTRPQRSPGGQTQDSWVADNTSPNNYLYNAASELNESTNNYQTFFRDYACPSEVQRRKNPSGADPYAASNPQGWYFENGDWYDNRPQGYFQDYRGSNGNNNAFFGSFSLGSGWNWADGMDMTTDMAFMSSSLFNRSYNLDNNDRWNIGQSIGTSFGGGLSGFINGLAAVGNPVSWWNPHGGRANVTEEEWLAAASAADIARYEAAISAGLSPGLTLGAWESVDQNGGGDPRLLNEVTKFGYLGIKYLANTTWLVDSEEKYTGPRTNKSGQASFVLGSTTGGLKGNPATVYIHPNALKDTNTLYIVVGHELIHVDHRLSGLYSDWIKRTNETYAHYASEYIAWKWVSGLGERSSKWNPEKRANFFYHLLPVNFRQTLTY